MLLDLDHIGVEGAAVPFRDFGVALVLRVRDRLEEIGISPGAADVFGWTASPGFGQARVCEARHRFGDALDLDRVLPAVAECPSGDDRLPARG
jgi:hypothetical protein